MESAEHSGAGKFDGLDQSSIVPVDVASRANRTWLIEQKKSKAAAAKASSAVTTSNSKPTRLDVKVSVSDSVLGSL